MEYTSSGKIIKKGLKNISYDILIVFLSNVLTKQRIWDMFEESEAILSGSNEQILLTQYKKTHCINDIFYWYRL